jgi:hypothetical protein
VYAVKISRGGLSLLAARISNKLSRHRQVVLR